MSSPTLVETQPIPIAAPVARLRWYAKAGMVLASVILLSLSFAPYHQFYLAWVGLVPLLVVVAHSRSAWTALGWGWLAGILFFTANMWWLVFVTGPGMAALMLLLGAYVGVPAMLLRGCGILTRDLRVRPRMAGRMLLIAAVWVAFEWLRGTWPLSGLPWLYMGHTQSPVLLLCQVADVTGVAGISFLVVAINALLALALLDGGFSRLRSAAAVLGGCLLAVLLYGGWRFSQEATDTSPGPTVMVVQPNIPQSDNGSKGASAEDYLAAHLEPTRAALAAGRRPDLVVWSETTVPPINIESRSFVAAHVPPGTLDFFNYCDQLISDLAQTYRINLLAGGMRWTDLSWVNHDVQAKDRRNVTYFFDADGNMEGRYDKVHLVPFGEYMPFKQAMPWAYRLLMKLSPYPEDYTLTPGDVDHLTVFTMANSAGRQWRFVTPICFEDIDAALVRDMFAPSDRSDEKRAQFIVNVTNDGWFRAGENNQHLQASIFRAIENRAPIARSVNTGISGFVDSMGRTSGLLAVGAEGTASQQLRIDSRTTFYTRFGDIFSYACVLATAAGLIAGMTRWNWIRPVARPRAGPTTV